MSAFLIFSELKHTSILKTVVSNSSRSLTYGKKLKQFGTHHILLTVSGDLFVGVFQTEQKLIDFQFLRTDVADFDISDKSVYVISKQDGKVYEGSDKPFSKWKQVCEEGQIRFEHICINKNDLILTSAGGVNVYTFTNDLRPLKFEVGTTINNTVAVISGSNFVTLLNRNSSKVMEDFKKRMHQNGSESLDFERYLNWKNIYQHSFSDLEEPSAYKATVSSILPYGQMLHATEIVSFGMNTATAKACDLQLANITKIALCDDHVVILTAAGQLFLNKSPLSDTASPEMLLPSDKHVLDVCCGKSRTYVVTNDLKICDANSNDSNDNYLSYDDNACRIGKDHLKDLDEVPMILASDELILVNKLPMKKGFHLTYHLTYQKTKYFNRILIKKIENNYCNEERDISEQELNEVAQFNQYCENLYYLLLLNTKSLRKFLFGGDVTDIIAVKMHREFVHQYQEMLTNHCNAISVGCMTMSSVENSTSETFNDLVVTLRSLILLMDKLCLPGLKDNWKKINDMIADETELAKSTSSFWSNQKNEAWFSLKKADRRVVLDSLSIPLKRCNKKVFSPSSRVVLFSDVIGYIGDRGLVVYPLQLIWLSTEENKLPKRLFVMNLNTPEEVISRYTQNMTDNATWVEKLEQYIRQNLDSQDLEHAVFRSGSYTFREGHEKYGGMKYEGFWRLGKIDGFGKLKGRNWNYDGELHRGQISGYGRMTKTENDSFKEYKGDFIDGKFHGYGKLKVTTTTVQWKYEGYFKNDEFDGFGSLDRGNYCYRGGFTKSLKDGFGVLVKNDRENHRVKYMGMFSNDKMNGKGIMITNGTTCIDKDCCIFGEFKDDKLQSTEKGVAIFRDGRSYKGVLTIEGPFGNGAFFYPAKDSKEIVTDPDETGVIGYVLSGFFRGSWEDVIVNNGKVTRSKQRSTALCMKDHIAVDSIWSSVSTSFAEHVFGTDSIGDLGHAEIWNKIAIYKARAERKQQLEKDNFKLKFANFNEETIAQFCQYGHELTLSSPEMLPIIAEDVDNTSTIISSAISSDEENELNIHPHPHSNLPNILDIVPEFGRTEIDGDDWEKLQEYLGDAFKNRIHPLCHLYEVLLECFFATYSQSDKDSFLCEIAKQELITMGSRIYTSFIVHMFPALPKIVHDLDGNPIDPTPFQLMYPIVLTDTIYLTLLQLYVHQYREWDELYQAKMLFFEGRTDEFIMQHLQYNEADKLQNVNFKQAVDLFASLKNNRNACETMELIRQVFNLLDKTVAEHGKEGADPGADELIPLTEMLVVKANVPQFGATISTLTGLMSFERKNLYPLTTLQALYTHLLNVNLFKT